MDTDSHTHLPPRRSIFDVMPKFISKLLKRDAHEALKEEQDLEKSKNKDEKPKKPMLQQLKSHTLLLLKILPYLWPKFCYSTIFVFNSFFKTIWYDRGKYLLQLRVVFAMTFLLFSKLCSVATPFAYKYVIDTVSTPDATYAMVWWVILLYGLGQLSKELFSNLRDSIFVKVQQNALQTIAIKTFAHLHQLSISFHIQRKTGGVLQAISRVFPIFIEVGLVSFILIFRLAWLSIIILAIVIFYTVFTIGVTEWRSKFRRSLNEAENEANDKAVDSLLNYETVKYFSNEAHEANRYQSALQKYTIAATKSQDSLAFLNVGQSFVIAMGQFAVLMITAAYVVNGTMTVGDLVLVNTYVLQIYAPLSFLGTSYRMIKQSLVDLENMFDLLNKEPDIKDPLLPVPCEIPQGEIRFENVKFHYKEKENIEVLKGVSFTVKPHTQTAIIGGSGAGKSTICKLLFRFYEPTDGRILIDGKDISQMKQAELRKKIGIVPQDCVLFNDTILYNIQYGNLNATQQEIEEAASTANILKMIQSLPSGFDTKVGERGLRLSGGEKQRVSIARCVLKQAPIVIFDEATSALDSHTEKEIQDNLKEIFRGKTTTIVLAHRLSTIIDSDEIIVLKGGVVVERGNFEQLMRIEDGEFKKLWLKQSEAAQQHQQQQQETTEVLLETASSTTTVPHSHPPINKSH